MSILRNLFCLRSGAYVQRWVADQIRRYSRTQELCPESLFAAWMSLASTFARSPPRSRGSQKQSADEVFSRIEKHYSGDASVFEIGCYTYFRTDLWLYSSRPGDRRWVSNSFIRQFTDLFSRALRLDAVPDLFAERVGKYGELVQTGADMERYHFILGELIKRTRDNALPRHVDFDHLPVELGDPFEDMVLKLRLGTHEAVAIPGCCQMVKNVLDYRESQRSAR